MRRKRKREEEEEQTHLARFDKKMVQSAHASEPDMIVQATELGKERGNPKNTQNSRT